MPNMIQPALPDLAAISFKRTKPSPATKVDSTSQPMITDKTPVACPDGTAASAPNSYSISTSTSKPQPELRSTRPDQTATTSYPSPGAEKTNRSTHTTNLPESVFNENMQSAGFTIVRRRSTKSAAQPTPDQQEKQKQKQEQVPDHSTGSRYKLLPIEEPEAADDVVSEATGTATSPLVIAEPKSTAATKKKKSRKPKKNKKSRADTKVLGCPRVNVASVRHGEGSGTSVPQQEQNAAEENEGEDKEGEGEKADGGRGFLNIISRPEYLFLIVWVVLAEVARRIFDVKTGQD
ncbi:hypothetical protein CLCR_07466 [Cladophialophora carrionii]|uniref:Uncharacterized protein n=1 Tax=Cladophialophora carrionii TaxID=86049 RepID=A0A1C1CMH2_9EURO|nr:hypothetical protein CLCR_07466 [Cladophialophora carrionii]